MNVEAQSPNARRFVGADGWLFVAVVLLTFALYFPGLSGGWLFDDYPNIVDNQAVHVTTSAPGAWLNAMWASPSSSLQRPLASLSFALNYYFSGLDPGAMKATNVAIHLLNGLLLFLLLRALIALPGAASSATSPGKWLPLLASAAWLVHPINVSAVLYVVQRMESLAQVFVLAGLMLYLDARRRQQAQRGAAAWRLWIGVPACTALGMACKESAMLLPLYALLLELAVFRSHRRARNSVIAFFTVFLVIPGMLGLLWLVPTDLSASAYAHRPFTLGERLLTEPRVLIHYVVWTLLPAPGFFSFYRDDFPVSTNLWQPWTTLPAIGLLGTLAAGAWFLRARRPLAALGIAWFLAAHLLTATIIPLELVFEHRNYFASAGLLLAAFDLVLPREGSAARLALARRAMVVCVIALAAGSLSVRAQVWSKPVVFALTEAARHPHSPRATYGLGRTYVILSGYRADSPDVPRAIAALDAAARVPGSSILPETGSIMLASRTGLRVQERWWDSMVRKLTARSTTTGDANAVKSLTACQREGHCVLDDQRMLNLYLAALSHQPADPAVLYSYAIFAFNRLHDTELALKLTREAAKSRDLQYQLNLVNFLIDIERFDEASAALRTLEGKVRPGGMHAAITKAANRLAAARKIAVTDQ